MVPILLTHLHIFLSQKPLKNPNSTKQNLIPIQFSLLNIQKINIYTLFLHKNLTIFTKFFTIIHIKHNFPLKISRLSSPKLQKNQSSFFPFNFIKTTRKLSINLRHSSKLFQIIFQILILSSPKRRSKHFFYLIIFSLHFQVHIISNREKIIRKIIYNSRPHFRIFRYTKIITPPILRYNFRNTIIKIHPNTNHTHKNTLISSIPYQTF